MSTLCDKGIEGIQYAKDNLPKVENILNDITAKIETLKDSNDLKDLLELIQNNVEERANYLASPVELEENTLYPMGNYGSAMTAYSVLALWVGMILLVSMFTFKHMENINLWKYTLENVILP